MFRFSKPKTLVLTRVPFRKRLGVDRPARSLTLKVPCLEWKRASVVGGRSSHTTLPRVDWQQLGSGKGEDRDEAKLSQGALPNHG